MKRLSSSTWGQAVLLLLIVTVAYFQTWIDLWPYWNGTTGLYAHGVPIVLAVLWLFWRIRPAVDGVEPTADVRIVPIILSNSFIWLLAERANIFLVYVILWPVLAFLALWVGLGLRAALLLATPLGFLYFAMPVWDILQPPLQTVASTMVGFFAKLFGLPAALDGNYITLPTGKIFIAVDCSGAHFLCISLAVGTLASILRDDLPRTRILILAIAGLLSMAFNWLRILLITLAHLHPELENAMDWLGGHVIFGWVIFAIGLLVLGLVLRFVPRTPYDPVHRDTADRSEPTRPARRASFWLAASALVVLPVIAWVLPRLDTYPAERAAVGMELPFTTDGPVAPDLWWSPHFPGAVWEDRVALISEDGTVVEVYANRYHEQSQGSELISHISHLFDTSTFSTQSTRIVNLHDPGGGLIPARSDTLTDSSGRLWLTVYTYLVDNEPIANSRRVQLVTAIQAMYSRAPAGVIAVAAPCSETCETQVTDIEATFIRALKDYRETLDE